MKTMELSKKAKKELEKSLKEQKKMEDEMLLVKLRNDRMYWSVSMSELRDFIYCNTDYQSSPTVRSRFVEVIQMYEGRLLLRTFAYRNSKRGDNKKEDMLIQEVCRRIQGCNEVIISRVYHSMSGRGVEYDEYAQRKTSASAWDDFNAYSASAKNWWFYGYPMYSREEWIEKLNIQYCQYFSELNKTNMTFFEYVCTYLEQPKIELLVKAGMSHWVKYHRHLKFDEKRLDKIFNIEQKWVPYLKELTYADLKYIRNKKYKVKNMNDLEIVKEIARSRFNNIKKILEPKLNDFIEKNKEERIWINNHKELKKRVFDYSLYNDYLGFAEQLGYDINDEYIKFNKNWKTLHDEMSSRIKAKRNEKVNGEIHEVYSKLLKYVYSANGFVIIPAENAEQLEYESKVMHHCVSSYTNNYAKGETNIMFIRKVDDVTSPLATLEFKKNKIIQCRAIRNQRPDSEVLDFVNSWKEQYKLEGIV